MGKRERERERERKKERERDREIELVRGVFFFFLSIKVYAVYAWDTHLAGLIKVDPKNKYSNSILMPVISWLFVYQKGLLLWSVLCLLFR